MSRRRRRRRRWIRRRRRLPGVAAAVVVAVAAGLAAVVVGWLRRARRAAADVPLSPLTAAGRVGPDWPERTGVATETEPPGEMDDFSAFARPGFDPERVPAEVRDFYERTAAYRMTYRVRWHAPFRLGAAAVAPLTGALEQLNLPGRSGRGGRLHSRFVGVSDDADPRDDARAWVRTDDDGDAVFVAVYASHRRDDERFVNIAVPLPGGNLSTVLRMEHLDGDDSGVESRDDPGGESGGVLLHTRAAGDPGLYLVTPLGAVALPMNQEFRVRPDRSGAESGIVATQEMWLCGRQFLTVEYRAERTGEAARGYDSTSTS
ncbi:hypothetical protein [Halobaculum sp. P14]|uniref:hypothetical protein n=1 Tax=Halobaculum sp. P14 TaxID=3421638 RepID=UPI003EBF3FEE